MSKPLIIEDEPLTPELARAFENSRRNVLWFNEHVEELEVYKRYRGKYVASADGELFVADSAQEIDRLVHDKYPDEIAHVRYIPKEKRYRTIRNQEKVLTIIGGCQNEPTFTRY